MLCKWCDRNFRRFASIKVIEIWLETFFESFAWEYKVETSQLSSRRHLARVLESAMRVIYHPLYHFHRNRRKFIQIESIPRITKRAKVLPLIASKVNCNSSETTNNDIDSAASPLCARCLRLSESFAIKPSPYLHFPPTLDAATRR